MGNCTGRSFKGRKSLLDSTQTNPSASSESPAEQEPGPWTPPVGTPHPRPKQKSPFKGEDGDEAVSPVPCSTENSFCALGAGCYWGTEKFVARSFSKQPNLPEGKVVSGKVGFMGPKTAPANPTYEQVCSGKTGHVEVYNVEYSGGDAFFEALVRYYFSFHDPTTLNRQGNDTGTQYASVIYCYTQSQIDIANKVKNELQALINSGAAKKLYQSVRVSTDVRPVEAPFYPAHDEHQDYLGKNPDGYCNHSARVIPWT